VSRDYAEEQRRRFVTRDALTAALRDDHVYETVRDIVGGHDGRSIAVNALETLQHLLWSLFGEAEQALADEGEA